MHCPHTRGGEWKVKKKRCKKMEMKKLNLDEDEWFYLVVQAEHGEEYFILLPVVNSRGFVIMDLDAHNFWGIMESRDLRYWLYELFGDTDVPRHLVNSRILDLKYPANSFLDIEELIYRSQMKHEKAFGIYRGGPYLDPREK